MYLSTRSPPALTSWLELNRANWTLREGRGGEGRGGEGRGGERRDGRRGIGGVGGEVGVAGEGW